MTLDSKFVTFIINNIIKKYILFLSITHTHTQKKVKYFQGMCENIYNKI